MIWVAYSSWAPGARPARPPRREDFAAVMAGIVTSMRAAFPLVMVVGILVFTGTWSYWRSSRSLPQTDASSPASSPASTAVAPVVAFEAAEYLLGELPWHSRVPFELRLANRDASREVVLERVHSGCGCAVIDADPLVGSPMPPASALTIRGLLDTPGRRGAFRTRVQAFFTNGDTCDTVLVADVRETYQVLPAEIDFGVVAVADSGHGEPRFASFRSPSAQLVGRPDSDSPWLEASFERVSTDEARIAVGVVPRFLQHGKQSGRLVFSTDDSYRPTFSLLVSVEGVAKLRPAPAHVFLHPTGQANVRFLRSDGSYAMIASIETVSELLVVDPLPEHAGVVIRRAAGAGRPRLERVSVADTNGDRATVFVTGLE